MTDHGPGDTYFSIVIPMYNRARFIKRAVESCLRQDFADFEIIVVDDGSEDESIDVVRSLSDSRITLLRHERNRGVGPARNTGVDAARGQWVICLDSDDEFEAGALGLMYARSREVGDGIANVRFMCRFDSGLLSPDPPLRDEIWTYPAYAASLDAQFGRRQECLACVRTRTFETVRYPEDRALELQYHLDFAQEYDCRTCPDVVRRYHQDADNQFCFSASPERSLKQAADVARSLDTVLVRHGAVLRAHAPKSFMEFQRAAATAHFLAGHRREGLKYALRYGGRVPFSMRLWGTVASGLIGPRPLAWLQAQWVTAQIRRARAATSPPVVGPIRPWP